MSRLDEKWNPVFYVSIIKISSCQNHALLKKKVSEDPDCWLALMVVFWKNRPEHKQTYPKDSKLEEVYIPTKMLL